MSVSRTISETFSVK